MVKVTADLANKLARRIADNRGEAGWEEALWEELSDIDGLDTKQVDILFGMIVARWDAASHKPVEA